MGINLAFLGQLHFVLTLCRFFPRWLCFQDYTKCFLTLPSELASDFRSKQGNPPIHQGTYVDSNFSGKYEFKQRPVLIDALEPAVSLFVFYPVSTSLLEECEFEQWSLLRDALEPAVSLFVLYSFYFFNGGSQTWSNKICVNDAFDKMHWSLSTTLMRLVGNLVEERMNQIKVRWRSVCPFFSKRSCQVLSAKYEPIEAGSPLSVTNLIGSDWFYVCFFGVSHIQGSMLLLILLTIWTKLK
ncbi:hypothetical protein NC651_028382 [Populus alba x Populus x berolinensis]|nr:hypothetical protein NC651_028382 [Populus alba x Populus x berolinensis]